MLMCPWWFWKELLALMACKHVYYQHVKYLRKSLHWVAQQTPKGISVKLGMGRSTDHLSAA